MKRIVSSHRAGRKRGLYSFTLVELLVVMVIIAILLALVLSAAQGVMAKAARSRAQGEITAIAGGLESYKLENGSYPVSSYLTGLNGAYPADPSVAGGVYQESSELLYQALTGKLHYTDPSTATVVSYMPPFKTSQLGNYTAGSGLTYIQDPWNFSYGYTTGDVASPQQDPPENGTGFYDLWSTGGTTPTSSVTTNAWITNWH